MNDYGPYYLYASDSPGMDLTSSPFDVCGYGVERKSTLILLPVKHKLGFIDGLPRPKDNSLDVKAWVWYNYMVFAWMLKLLAPNIRYNGFTQKLFYGNNLRMGMINQTKHNYLNYRSNC